MQKNSFLIFSIIIFQMQRMLHLIFSSITVDSMVIHFNKRGLIL